MATQCPKCKIENTKDSVFCKKCGTQLKPSHEISITRTILKPSDELAIGSTFAGKYNIIAEIGRGGMGVVYKAEDLKLKRFVAIKLLPSELAKDEEAKERFIREAQAAAALSHPNICTIHEVDESEGKTYIAMEFIDGHSLRERTVKGPLSIEEVLEVSIQIAQGLTEAHQKGIIHRDIKSANIMVDEKGQPKIMDFGLAKVAGGALITKEARPMGTVAYMSPEQARGEEVDHRSDIWSFGVVLYEMLTGQLLFRAEEEKSLIYSIENREPASIEAVNPDVPAALDQIIKKALEKDKKNRYQSIVDLQEDLFIISKGIVPPKIEAVIRRAKFARLKRIYIYGGLVLLSVALIALLIHFLGSLAKPSIAVLPFENMSKDPEIEYICDGITEEIIDKLARFPSLKVIASSSVFHYKGKEIIAHNVGKELAVGTVLVSRMNQRGSEASIRVELVNTRDSSLIWSHQYIRMSSEIFMIKEEIVSSIVNNLIAKITPLERDRLADARQVNPEAYDAYLKGRYFLSKATIEDKRRASEYFQQSIEIDPSYAPAYIGLAQFYRTQPSFGILKPEDAFAKAEAAVKKALELDDTLAIAYSAQAYVKFNYYWDWEGAEQDLKRAFELSPGNADIHRDYAIFLSRVGRHEEAISQWNRVMELDPVSLTGNALELGKLFYFARQYDSAIEQLLKTIKLSPMNDVAYVYLCSAYGQKAMYEEALAAAQKAGIYSNLAVAVTHAKAGREEEARGMLGALTGEWGKRVPTFIAFLYASLGEKDNAVEWLQKGYDQHDHFIHQIKVEPMWDPLRSDPRFQALLRKMNFPE